MTSSFVIKEVAGIKIPDSSLAKAVTTLAREASPDFLFNHAFRTYVFGIMAGKKLGIAYDAELLYVGAILHDLGLTETFERAERFEVDGADVARDLCVEHKVPPGKAELVWDAIALHSTVGIPPRKSSEAALLQIGAGTDVLGFGAELIGIGEIQRVIADVPRQGFSKKFLDLIIEIGRRKTKQHAFTWVAEVGHQHVHGFPSPTYKALFPQWAALVEPEAQW